MGEADVSVQDVVAPDSAFKIAEHFPRISYSWKSLVDIRSTDLQGYDYVINLAAQADVPLAISSPRWTYVQNLESCLQLLEALRGSSVKKTVFMSSEYLYGRVPPENLPITEDQPFNPTNAYAASKAASELLIRSYVQQYGLPCMVLRSTTMFGERSRTNQAIPIFIRQALKDKPITIEGDGSQSRDFTYVENTVHGIRLALDSDLKAGTWNIGSGKETTIAELAETISRMAGSEGGIEYRSWRAGEEGIRISISIEKAHRELKYSPIWSLGEGLKRTIEWFKDHQRSAW